MSRGVRAVVVSEVARWKAFLAPFGATAAEVAACGARRAEYAGRLADVLRGLPPGAATLKAVEQVLAEVRPGEGMSVPPEPAAVLSRVRERLGRVEPAPLVVCVDCEREGGVTLHGRHYGPQPAAIGPVHGAVARCGWHLERAACERRAETNPATPKPAWTREGARPGEVKA